MPGQADWLADPYRHGEAYVDFVDVTSPAAGANKAFGVPGQYGVQVLAARATLSTDANAANRLLSLDFITPNSVTRVRNCAAVVWTANTTSQTFIWNCAWSVSEWATNTPVLMPVNELLVPPSWSIQFTVDNIQVGDQLAGLSLVVLKVPTGA